MAITREGAAAGAVPVWGTGGMVDVVEHDKTGLVIPPDTVGATMLTDAVGESGDAASMVARARRRLQTRYNWRSVAANIAARW